MQSCVGTAVESVPSSLNKGWGWGFPKDCTTCSGPTGFLPGSLNNWITRLVVWLLPPTESHLVWEAGHCSSYAVFEPPLHVLAQGLLNAVKNGGVWIVVEQQSQEPSMYWGVRGAESAGFKPKADGEAWGGGAL